MDEHFTEEDDLDSAIKQRDHTKGRIGMNTINIKKKHLKSLMDETTLIILLLGIIWVGIQTISYTNLTY